jgi:hypothetical protein
MAEGVGFNVTGATQDADECACCAMEFKTRLICGGIASGVAAFFGVGACVQAFLGHVDFFAVLYTISIIATLVGSFFIAGPKRHWERLKDCPAHVISLVVIVIAIVIIIVGACAVRGAGSLAITILGMVVYLVALAFFNITLNEMTWTIVKRFIPCCRSQ